MGITYVNSMTSNTLNVYYTGDLCFQIYEKSQLYFEYVVSVLCIGLDLISILKFRKYFGKKDMVHSEKSMKKQERIMLMMVIIILACDF